MNSKNKKIIIVLVVAFLVAIAGGIALYMYLVPKKTTIYVFKQNVAAGTVVTYDMLMPIQADSDIYVAGAKTTASERYVTGANVDAVLKSGDSLRMDVTEGMPLTLSLLTTSGGSTVEMAMNPEKVAVTIAVSSVTGITSELKAGSKVNVYATGLFSNNEYKTTLIFEGLRILAVNKNDQSLTSVTLETSTDESLKLIYYASSFSIYLGLIDSSGYEFRGTDVSFSDGSVQNYTGIESESGENIENQDTTAPEPTTESQPEPTSESQPEPTTESQLEPDTTQIDTTQQEASTEAR